MFPKLIKNAAEHEAALAHVAGLMDAAAYDAMPPGADEFGSEDVPLAWEGDGWDGFDASR